MPEDRQPPVRAQHLCRLHGTGDGVDPAPGLGGDDGVKGSTGRLPVFEGCDLDLQTAGLRDFGSATVADNLTTALTALFGPVAVAIIPLITFRDELRSRLRQANPSGGVPILTHAATAIAAYLIAERELGRIAPDADIDSLTLSLVGGGHLLFASRDSAPTTAAVHKLVTAVIATAA